MIRQFTEVVLTPNNRAPAKNQSCSNNQSLQARGRVIEQGKRKCNGYDFPQPRLHSELALDQGCSQILLKTAWPAAADYQSGLQHTVAGTQAVQLVYRRSLIILVLRGGNRAVVTPRKSNSDRRHLLLSTEGLRRVRQSSNYRRNSNN